MSVERSGEAGPRSASIDADNPWPGLATFTEDQRAFFHGRDEEILDLTQLAERRPLVVLFGQSGLGKSSMLQAGVFPRLRTDGFCPVYIRLDHADGAPSPTEQIKEMVRTETMRVGAWTRPGAARPGETLWEFFHHRDDRLIDRDGLGVVPVLVFDQFEELFTLGAARGERRDRAVAFMKELAELVENRPSAQLVARLDQSSEEMDAFDFGRTDYRVIITLREDFLPDLETLKTIMPALMQKRMRLARMTGQQALEAVLKPGGALVTEDVARAIVEFVAGARGGSAERLAELDVEPALLSVICRELNERRRALGQAQITADLVSGNRREILTDFYERSVADLPAPMRAFVEDRLLTKSGFRDNLALEAALEFPGVTQPLIDTLVARRLLRLEDRLGVQRVELTHDVLAEVIRASRDARQQRLAAESLRERERVTRRRMWFARAIAASLFVGLTGVSWVAWRAIRAEREQALLRADAETLRGREAQLRKQAQVQELLARRKAYASDMNLVQQALAVDHLGRAQDLLNRNRPRPGDEDLRGWEWRYLWQYCQSDAQAKICENRNRIGSTVVSSDGRWLAVAEVEKGGLFLFDLKTREEIRVPAGDGYVHVSFSPREQLLAVSMTDYAATANPRYHVILWDLTTRQKVGDIPLEFPGGKTAFSNDGQTLATSTSSTANQIELWRVADGKRLAGFPAPVEGNQIAQHNPFAATRDLKFAAHVTREHFVRVVDLTTGTEKWSARGGRDLVTALAFSPDGRILASAPGFQESPIRLWDVESGRQIGALDGHRTFVQALAFWPDGKTLASAGGDQTIRLWDIESQRLLKTLRGHKLEVWSLALLPDNRTLASGGKDGTVMLWDTTATRALGALTTWPKAILTWHFAPDSKSVITVDDSGRVERWEGTNFQQKIELLVTAPGDGALIDRNAPVVAIAQKDGRLDVWEWNRKTKVRAFQFEGDDAAPIALAGLGSKVYVARGQRFRWATIEEWSVETGERTRLWTIPLLQGSARGKISDDEKRLILTANTAGHVILDIASGRVILSDDLGVTTSPTVSPDGKLSAIASSRGFTKIRDIATGREIAMLRGTLQGMHGTAFSPDGSRLAVRGGGFEALIIWDMASYESLVTLKGGAPNNLPFMPQPFSFSASGDLVAGTYAGPEGNRLLHLWRAPSWAEIEQAEAAERARAVKP